MQIDFWHKQIQQILTKIYINPTALHYKFWVKWNAFSLRRYVDVRTHRRHTVISTRYNIY